MQRWKIPCLRLKNTAPLFYEWISEFELALKNYKFITEADAVQVLAELFKNSKIKNVGDIITLGFDQIPPLYLDLIKVASKKLVQESPEYRYKKIVRTPPRYIEFFDMNQEIRAAARWAKKIHIEHPEHRVGIILSDSALQLKATERILSEELNPTSYDPNHAYDTCPYEASTGTMLSDTPIISTALLLLSVNVSKLNLEKYCQLINSPFWGKIIRYHLEQSLKNIFGEKGS